MVQHGQRHRKTKPSVRYWRFCFWLTPIIAIFCWRSLSLYTESLEVLDAYFVPMGTTPGAEPSHIEDSNCQLVATHKFTPSTNSSNHHPIWVPSYPGSGSELFRKMIVALTGMDGGNWYDTPDRCSNHPATCKTHCPFLQKENCPQGRGLLDNNADRKTLRKKQPDARGGFANIYYHSSAILLIRNPRDAIASYVNWRWENRRGVETHTQQAPREFWMRQRDEEFPKLLGGWRQVLLWWAATDVRQSIYNVSLVIPYEKFVNEEQGPALLLRLAEELERANIRVLVPSNQFQCLWRQIVKAPKSSTKRVGHKYIPGYTKAQKNAMLMRLNDLITLFSSNPPRADLVGILSGYWEDVASNLPIEE